MGSRTSTIVALVGALTLVGCAGRAFKVEDVSGLRVSPANGRSWLCPLAGATAVRALMTLKDGAVLDTDGDLRFIDLVWKTSPRGVVDNRGRISITAPVLEWYDDTIKVQASVRQRPDVSSTIELKPRFDCGGVAYFDGLHGEAGGRHGADGPEITVDLAYLDTKNNGRLVLVKVTSPRAGEPYYFLVDPRGAAREFTIAARGGSGGRGRPGRSGRPGRPGRDGRSGRSGGTCQDGEDGEDGTDGGPGGDGGDGGPGGDGGAGGRIVVRVPPEHPELASLIRYNVDGGAAGAGGMAGSGGSGGRAGSGGSGGSSGSSRDHDGEYCSTSPGRRGRSGQRGRSGRSGIAGEPGRTGPNGEIVSVPATPEDAFAGEIARGLPIVTGDERSPKKDTRDRGRIRTASRTRH